MEEEKEEVEEKEEEKEEMEKKEEEKEEVEEGRTCLLSCRVCGGWLGAG